MLFLCVLVFRLNLCCVIKAYPARTGFEPSPARRGAFAGLHLNNGEHTDAGKLASPVIVSPRAFTDVQIRNADFYKERNFDSCCFRCVDVYTIYIKHTVSRIGVSAFLGVIQNLERTFLRLGIRLGLTDAVPDRRLLSCICGIILRKVPALNDAAKILDIR